MTDPDHCETAKARARHLALDLVATAEGILEPSSEMLDALACLGVRGRPGAGAVLSQTRHPGDCLYRELTYGVAVEIARGWRLDPQDAADVFDGMASDEDRWSVVCCAKSRLAVQRRWIGDEAMAHA